MFKDASIPTDFDPTAYIADLRAAGYRLEATWVRRGEFEAHDSFIIHGKPGFREDHEIIQEKWWPSRQSVPDWTDQVARALRVEQ
jgi:hypothetical protein